MEPAEASARQLTTSELGRTAYGTAVASGQFPVEFSTSANGSVFLAGSWERDFARWLPFDSATATLRATVPTDQDIRFLAVVSRDGRPPKTQPDEAFCLKNSTTWRAKPTDAPIDSQTSKAWGGQALDQIRFSGAAQLAREDLTDEEVALGNEKGYWPVEFAFNEVAWAKAVAVGSFSPPEIVLPDLLASVVDEGEPEELPLSKDEADNVWRLRVPLKAVGKTVFRFMVHCDGGVTPDTGPIVADGWDSRSSRPPILATNEITVEVTDLSSSEVIKRRLAAPGRIDDGTVRSTQGAQLARREQEIIEDSIAFEKSVKESAGAIDDKDQPSVSTAPVANKKAESVGKPAVTKSQPLQAKASKKSEVTKTDIKTDPESSSSSTETQSDASVSALKVTESTRGAVDSTAEMSVSWRTLVIPSVVIILLGVAIKATFVDRDGTDSSESAERARSGSDVVRHSITRSA